MMEAVLFSCQSGGSHFEGGPPCIVSMALEPIWKEPGVWPRCFRYFFTIKEGSKAVKNYLLCKTLRVCGKGKSLGRGRRRDLAEVAEGGKCGFLRKDKYKEKEAGGSNGSHGCR